MKLSIHKNFYQSDPDKLLSKKVFFSCERKIICFVLFIALTLFALILTKCSLALILDRDQVCTNAESLL